MFARQRIALTLLSESGGCLNKLDLVKLLFLLNVEGAGLPGSATTEFLPYHRGPYSFTLAHDLGKLEQAGLLTQSSSHITLTERGKLEATKTSADLCELVVGVRSRHGKHSTDDLINHIYTTFHWYTVNSKWVHRRAATRPVAPIAIYTTSYEGVHIDGLLNRLMRHGIARLIDVRANPVARRFGFHKSTLARICPKVDIEYLHFPEVGIPGSWRTELDSLTAYEQLFQRYQSEVLPDQRVVLDTLVKFIREKPTALMCKEAEPRCCHRTTLANFLATEMGLPVIDIGSELNSDHS